MCKMRGGLNSSSHIYHRHWWLDIKTDMLIHKRRQESKKRKKKEKKSYITHLHQVCALAAVVLFDQYWIYRWPHKHLVTKDSIIGRTWPHWFTPLIKFLRHLLSLSLLTLLFLLLMTSNIIINIIMSFTISMEIRIKTSF